MQGRRSLRLLADRRMPRGGGIAAIGTIRRSLPSAKAALITATREEMRTPQAATDVKAAAGGLAAWPGAFRKLNALPTLRSAKTQIGWP